MVTRVLVSAPHKSSGKTTVSIGLTAALAGRGHVVQTFKKGPDYIDPMWLSRASGRACFNLDFNTQSPEEICDALTVRSRGASFALIEGNMGLHDGVDAKGGDSTAALARLTGAPVILVVDCTGLTRGIAPLLLGFQAFDPAVRIGGVVLNRVASSRQRDKLVAAVESYTDIPVLGSLPRASELAIVERHLGLTTPAETDAAETRIVALADLIDENIDLDRVVALARGAATMAASSSPIGCDAAKGRDTGVVIAVARDAAFGFYYADDLEALQRAGARLVFFSPLADRVLPVADGILIGGGFPETHMAALEANEGMRRAIHDAATRGMPIYAECGGLMYLARSIRWGGEMRAMAGVIDADIVVRREPQGRGLVAVEPTAAFPWPQTDDGAGVRTSIAAHEFHYAEMIDPPRDARYAWRMLRGHGINGTSDGIVIDNVLAAFTHQRDTSANRWAARFAAFVRERRAAAQRHAPGEQETVR